MRFGRRDRDASDGTAEAPAADQAHEPASGPHDVADVDLDADGPPRADLGGLLVTGGEGIELRLQADQQTGAVTSVLLAGADGAVELRAFAAPKSGGLWEELRREMIAEAARLGGTGDELPADSPADQPQLRLRVPVKGVDGRPAVQVSRVAAYEGARWLLRATFLGAAATTADADGPLERAVRDVVVVRGQGAMSPREPLVLRLPPEARPTHSSPRTIEP